MTPHLIPKLTDDSLIFASAYTNRLHLLELLQFLLVNYQPSITTGLSEHTSSISYSDAEQFGNDWRESVLKLFSNSFPAYDENGRKGRFHWLDYILYDDENKIFYYKFCDSISANLDLLREKYPSDFKGLLLFTRTNSFHIYKYLMEHAGPDNTVNTTCRDLIEACGLQDGIYSLIAEFKRGVLKAALNDFKKYLNRDITVESDEDQLCFFISGGRA